MLAAQVAERLEHRRVRPRALDRRGGAAPGAPAARRAERVGQVEHRGLARPRAVRVTQQACRPRPCVGLGRGGARTWSPASRRPTSRRPRRGRLAGAGRDRAASSRAAQLAAPPGSGWCPARGAAPGRGARTGAAPPRTSPRSTLAADQIAGGPLVGGVLLRPAPPTGRPAAAGSRRSSRSVVARSSRPRLVEVVGQQRPAVQRRAPRRPAPATRSASARRAGRAELGRRRRRTSAPGSSATMSLRSTHAPARRRPAPAARSARPCAAAAPRLDAAGRATAPRCTWSRCSRRPGASASTLTSAAACRRVQPARRHRDAVHGDLEAPEQPDLDVHRRACPRRTARQASPAVATVSARDRQAGADRVPRDGPAAAGVLDLVAHRRAHLRAAARATGAGPSRRPRPPRSRGTAGARAGRAGRLVAAQRRRPRPAPASTSTSGVGEQLGVAQRVGHAVGGDRVLEVAGVADQRPARPPRPAHEARRRRPSRCSRARRRAAATRSASAGAAAVEQRGEGVLAARARRSWRIRAGVVPTKTQVSPSLVGMQPGGGAVAVRPLVAGGRQVVEVAVQDGAAPSPSARRRRARSAGRPSERTPSAPTTIAPGERRGAGPPRRAATTPRDAAAGPAARPVTVTSCGDVGTGRRRPRRRAPGRARCRRGA